MFGCSNKAKSIVLSALIQPIFEHAFSVWSPHSKQNINLLESILRHRGARWACNSCYDLIHHQCIPSSASCCKTLHWQSLSFHCDVSSLVIAHDIIHDRSCIPQHFLPITIRSHSHH